jgi:hypothetical protein
MNINIINILPSKHPRLESKINYSTKMNHITMTCIHRGKDGRILNPQNQPKRLVISKKLNINIELGEILGLYYGDGTKNYPSGVEFTNFCPDLIKLWMDYLNKMNISNKKLYYKIKISENCKIKYNITKNEIINYWIDILNLSKEYNITIHWVKAKGTPSSYLRKYGSMVIGYSNTMFSIFFNTLINNINYFLKDESFRIGFIRGLFAAEGNINLRKNGSLSLIRIAGSRKARKFTSNILKNYFNVSTKDDDQSNQIYMGRLEYEKLKHLDMIALHPEKKAAYEKGYEILMKNINRKPDKNIVLKNKTAIKILKLLKNEDLYYKNIIKNIGITRDYLKMIINGYEHGKFRYFGLHKLGIISKTKIGTEFKISLTNKGQMFVRNLQ